MMPARLDTAENRSRCRFCDSHVSETLSEVSTSSLQDFGVERFDRPRLKVKDEDGRVACPVTATPIEHTEGEIDLGVPALADATLKGALSSDFAAPGRSSDYFQFHSPAVDSPF